jgi:DNA-binding transcriptional LysR family regulator
MDDDINQLRVFVEVARQGGFTAAARVLDMPTSTVSRWVQELESGLGVRLLQRTTRRVQLTEIGEGYYQRGLLAVASVEEAQAWVRSQAEVPHGTLRLTTFQLFADTLLGPVLVSYLNQNPSMSVQVIINERDVDLVDERIDLAIRVGSLADSSLVVRKLADLTGWMVASPAYLAAHGPLNHPSELARHSNLVYRHDRETITLPFEDGEEQLEVALPSRCVANSIALVRQLTLGGLGIGFLPPMLAREDVAAGRLARVLPTWNTVSLPIYAVYPSRRHLAQKVRVFVDLLADQVTSEAVEEAHPHSMPTPALSEPHKASVKGGG